MRLRSRLADALAPVPRVRLATLPTALEPLFQLPGGSPFLMLARLFGAQLHHPGTDRWGEQSEELEKLTARLVDRGHRPYAIPMGGSTRTYTGKALAGVLGADEAGRFDRGDAVVFWHTGGQPAVFAPGGSVVGRSRDPYQAKEFA